MELIFKKGGKREGAGRKKLDDKKIPITIYLKATVVAKIDIRELKQSIVDFVEGKVPPILPMLPDSKEIYDTEPTNYITEDEAPQFQEPTEKEKLQAELELLPKVGQFANQRRKFLEQKIKSLDGK